MNAAGNAGADGGEPAGGDHIELSWNFWSAVICARPWRANASVRGLGLEFQGLDQVLIGGGRLPKGAQLEQAGADMGVCGALADRKVGQVSLEDGEGGVDVSPGCHPVAEQQGLAFGHRARRLPR